jgi:molybdate transport system regulatory protein
MEIKHKIWLEQDGHVIFGKGRDELLRTIDECQSLNAAVKKLNVSYRGAWARLKATEARLQVKLVEMPDRGRGMLLTPQGKALLAEYDLLEQNVNVELERALTRFREILEGGAPAASPS